MQYLHILTKVMFFNITAIYLTNKILEYVERKGDYAMVNSIYE